MKANLYFILFVTFATFSQQQHQFFVETVQNTQFLQPQKTLGPTILKILNEITFNVWQGFVEGFRQEEAHIDRAACFGPKALEYIQSTLSLTESVTKEIFFQNLAQVVKNMVLLAVDIKENCQVVSFLDELYEYCEDNCEGKKIMNRLMAQFSTLSKIYSQIIQLIYDTKPDSMTEQFQIVQDIGARIGEFFRLAIGYSN